jgi:Mg-chelatase subunit ChlD
MNPDLPLDPRQALEASLTALLLGELPPDQADFLRQAVAQDAELARTYARLEQTIGLVRETASEPVTELGQVPAPLKLSEERRQALLQRFKTVEYPKPRRGTEQKTSWLVPVGIAAVLVAMLGALVLPALSRAKSRSMAMSQASRAARLGTWSLGRQEGSSTPAAPEPRKMLNELKDKGPAGQGEAVAGPTATTPQTIIVLPSGGQPGAPAADQAVALELSVGKKYAYQRNGFPGGFGGGGLGGGPQPFAVNGAGQQSLPSQVRESTNYLLPFSSAEMAFRRRYGLRPQSAAPEQEIERVQQQPVAPSAAAAPGVEPTSGLPSPEPVLVDPTTGLPLPLVAAQSPSVNLARGRAAGDAQRGGSANGAASDDRQAMGQPLAGYKTPSSAGLLADTEEPKDEDLAGLRLSGGASITGAQQNGGPVLGDIPALGRLFNKGTEAESENRQDTTSNAYSLHIVGYVNVPSDKLTIVSNSPMLGEEKTVAGFMNKNDLAGYSRAASNLEDLKRERMALFEKLASEGVTPTPPGVSRVEIVQKAESQPNETVGLGQKLRGLFTGEVERNARVKIERDQPETSALQTPQAGATYDPYFMQTEFETIQSQAVLGKVVQKLKLDEAWAKERGHAKPLSTAEAVALLKQRLDLRRAPNSADIEIGVKSRTPEEAAELADAVAEAYQQEQQRQAERLALASVASLGKQYAEQNAKVQEAQAAVDQLRTRQQSLKQRDEVPAPKRALPPPEPQPEIQTRDNAFSTFSLNVSDVSFKLATASLEKGTLPEPASIRSEEFINAFDYRDPAPAPGVAVGFAWERAQYPFAQNRDLLRFSLKTAAQGRQAGRPLNVVLLLDNSGSMERADRVRIIHEALRVLAAQLEAQDTLSVVTFARVPWLWVDGVPGNQAGRVAEEVDKLTPQGGTNLGDALDLAYQTALRHYLTNGINRVVLLTDGAANLGNVDPEQLQQKVETNRKQGIALDCFGIGWEGYNDDLLEVLTRHGDGRYGFLNTPEEAATNFASQLAGALKVAAADVKVQVEFNPKRVTAYRQIGYARHQLTKEQFRDNTVEAAELGAAESGNALYVIEVNGGGEGPLAVVRVRYRVPGTEDYQQREWTVSYTGDAVPLEQASPAMRLAACAGTFAEWLAGSPYASEVNLDSLLACLNGVPEVYGADARPKQLEWMLRQAKSIAGGSK